LDWLNPDEALSISHTQAVKPAMKPPINPVMAVYANTWNPNFQRDGLLWLRSRSLSVADRRTLSTQAMAPKINPTNTQQNRYPSLSPNASLKLNKTLSPKASPRINPIAMRDPKT